MSVFSWSSSFPSHDVDILSVIELNTANDYYYNLIVYSEVKFKILFKLKNRDSDKVEVFSYLKEIFKFLNFLSSDEITMEISDYLIKKYNLKPNDALILATCKRYGIKYLLSLDGDFKIPCMNEELF